MALVNGSQILARSLRRLRVDTFFYIMGGPMMAAETASMEEGLRGIDVRHEQAAAMMAHAFGRVKNTLGVCMAASGPGATNLVTGVANAWADCGPLLLTGSGILWSAAEAELQQFVERAGIPFYTTPQGRGVVPDDHQLSFPTARATAFRETDLLLVIGTRINYVIGHLAPPRFNPKA